MACELEGGGGGVGVEESGGYHKWIALFTQIFTEITLLWSFSWGGGGGADMGDDGGWGSVAMYNMGISCNVNVIL